LTKVQIQFEKDAKCTSQEEQNCLLLRLSSNFILTFEAKIFSMNFTNKIILLAISTVLLASCKSDKNILYKSERFTIHKNKITQGENSAEVISPTSIKSNYKSTENERYSNRIAFKFSINEKDNDIAPGADRHVLITNQRESKIYVFGVDDNEKIQQESAFLPTDYDFTFKLDMNPVLKQFKEKGYYDAIDGTKIAQNDFKGVYIAGASLPLSWDFVNLDEKGLKLTDDNNDGIFEITVRLNPAINKQEKQWNLSQDISNKAKYSSDQPIVDALYNLSLEEAKLAIEPDSTFRTGAKWAGVWTRDISYSILLAFAYLEPEVAKISLLKKVNRDRIIQDTGSGGAWPVSSDRTTWALAAWEVYKATGDKDWLSKAFTIIKNSAADDSRTLSNEQTGLYSGESSFLDWREQTYPKWMSNKDIYLSQNLGTNAVHYQTHVILSKMAVILNQPSEEFTIIANRIKKGINDHLWMDDKGYYAQYLYGRNFNTKSQRYEALGEALSIIFGIADENQAKSIVSKSPLTEFGATCIYPQIPGIPPYHNNGIWPFVQSYWNLAAAKAGNEKVLEHGLASVYRAAGLFLTNYENMVAETGDFMGTEINSDRMLWSMAGNLSMVYRVFMGMQFDENAVSFNPVIPKIYGGKRTLTGFKYRNSILDITVEGYGNKIAYAEIDGVKSNPVISGDLSGKHTVYIKMANNDFSSDAINLVENKFTLATPIAALNGKTITWKKDPNAVNYLVYKNGISTGKTSKTEFSISDSKYAEYSITAIDKEGIESFMSEPILYSDAKPILIEVEDFLPKSNLNYVNFSGNGFVEITKDKNTKINIPVQIETDGDYYVDIKYSNGSGPWNTDNKCAIRSLKVNNRYTGVLVFPQRGTDEWSDWGYSNARKVHFKKGKNDLEISFEEWNNNMNVTINTAMIDQIKIYNAD